MPRVAHFNVTDWPGWMWRGLAVNETISGLFAAPQRAGANAIIAAI
jgi:hypothetical protein